ncbi:contractile injection system tape measure protein [Aquimarina algicola]|uniref:Uncharacterized protein n=1 Tax=Aquimarina algicola TaxID=2589995 RepID=A0A504J5U6_9FLAO|nr:contractile injection system tape measure protein [Aquimarina algicola]TPN83945.1 hypothetical protein FHK87_18445 [Aquimarina algicola]
MANTHLIGKQIMHLEVNSSKNPHELQQKMSQLVWTTLTPKLNALFDTLVGENEVIRFDTIEIDIGYFDLENLDVTKMINTIIDLLEKEIRDRLFTREGMSRSFRRKENNDISNSFNHSRNNFSVKDHSKDRFKKHKDRFQSGTDHKTTNDKALSTLEKRQSLQDYHFTAWLHWLEKGNLPSYSILPNEDWIVSVLEILATETIAILKLAEKIKEHPLALQRLILQHSRKDLQSIVEVYTGLTQKQVSQFFEELEIIFKSSFVQEKLKTSFRALEIKLWKQIFEMVILKREKKDSISIHIALLSYLKKIYKNDFETVIIHAITGDNTKKGVQEDSLLFKLITQEWSAHQKQEKTASAEEKVADKELSKPREEQSEIQEEHDIEELNPSAEYQNSKGEDEIITSQDHTDKTTEDSIAKEDEWILQEEEFTNEQLESPQFFNNAGVVLVHPFLHSFFRKLELIQGKDFKNFSARSKAVLLLHFLATGEEKPKEYDMVLPKFLCEMPVNMPLDHTLEITEDEKHEAEHLLQAAIEHWGVLGGTSPDGLRQGFLGRQGKLEKEQTGWKLYVEHNALDILLDRLPWNINIVKLLWMEEILKVEWR